HRPPRQASSRPHASRPYLPLSQNLMDFQKSLTPCKTRGRWNATEIQPRRMLMKLVRFGAAGAEKPGLIDADGKVRDLSGVVSDIAGDVLGRDGLARLKAHDTASLPLAPEGSRLGACVGRVG